MSTIDEGEARRRAAAAGLNKLDAAGLAQFAAGTKATAALVRQLPQDLHWSEEPAHVFRLAASSPGKGRPA